MPMYGSMLKNGHEYGFKSMPVQPRTFNNNLYRQQSYPLMQGMNGVQQMNWNPYMHSYPSSYYQPIEGINPYYLQQQQAFPQQQPVYQQQPANPSLSSDVFQNPLHPIDQSKAQKQAPMQSNGYPFMNPYPKASFLAKQPSGMKTVMNSFKSQDGSLDINKMVDTAGQMMNAVSQVSSVVKGFGGLFKA